MRYVTALASRVEMIEKTCCSVCVCGVLTDRFLTMINDGAAAEVTPPYVGPIFLS